MCRPAGTMCPMKGKIYFEGINVPLPEPEPELELDPTPAATPVEIRHPLPMPNLEPDPLHPIDVRRSRELLGLDQEQFAALLGVSVRAVKAWEHRKRNTSHARNCTGSARKLIQHLIAEHQEEVGDG